MVAGAATDETESVIAEGRKLLGGRAIFLIDHPRERMPQIYQMADLFVLCSLKEMLASARLEALASGLPCLMHREPVAEWAIADGGWTIDMAAEGELAGAIARLRDPAARQRLAEAARTFRADFSKTVILTIGSFILIGGLLGFIAAQQGFQQPATPPLRAPKRLARTSGFVLTGITSSGEERLALINGQVARVGDLLNGQVLVTDIQERGVTLRSGSKESKLNL